MLRVDKNIKKCGKQIIDHPNFDVPASGSSAGNACKKDQPVSSSAAYLRHHHQPDLVKVSSPKSSEFTRLENILDEKNRENDQLRNRLKHNAKGFEALALTVEHLTKKVCRN